MELVWPNLRLPVDEQEEALAELIAHKLKVNASSLTRLRILRRSLDARKKPELYFVYTVQFAVALPPAAMRRIMARHPDLREAVPEVPEELLVPEKKLLHRPIVVGTGPAGYFAALALARAGYKPLVIERGEPVEERTAKVKEFWLTGQLDPESNVQFGEGGAGTFSDGKLTTRIQDRRISEVLNTFETHGAPPEIQYIAKPHIGTDILKEVVKGIRRTILSLGGEIRFRARLTGLQTRSGRLAGVTVNGVEEIPAEVVILAVGHSARDVYAWLAAQGIALQGKAFAIGLRVEHPQRLINLAQYGVEVHPLLGPADYQLTYQDLTTGRGAYAFCMCPGGQVVAAASEFGGVVTNGMSEYRRDLAVANSALVVTVGLGDFPSAHPLAGIEFQRQWERRAFLAAGRTFRAPAQSVPDFLDGRVSGDFSLRPSYRPGVAAVDLHDVLPNSIGQVLERALRFWDTKLPGFAGAWATLTGVETRTSAPVRILRNEAGESVSLPGLFPAGEGAGYAGGIMSAAVDGLRIAERVMAQYAPAD